jgi:hypothetical protein
MLRLNLFCARNLERPWFLASDAPVTTTQCYSAPLA